MTDWRISITLPTGHTSHQPLVELGTVVTVWLGFAWLGYKILRLRRRLSARMDDKRN